MAYKPTYGELSKADGPETFSQKVEEFLNHVGQMLVDKNRKYGNSALDPVRIFSSADPIEQINVRIDDKLSRMQNRQGDEDEDVELDLIGYLVLKHIAKMETK